MTNSVFQAFDQDPEFEKCLKALVQTISTKRSHLTGIKAPDYLYTQGYASALSDIKKARGSGLFYPYLSSGIGNGAFVQLADGSIKYDFISGIGAHWTHGSDAMLEACIRGAIQDTVMQGNLQQNLDSLTLIKRLSELSGLDHAFLTTSGAMANENALKILFQYRQPATRLLAFEHCFSGRTLALAHVTDKSKYRVGLPDTLTVDYLPFYDANHPEESTQKAISLLESYISRYPDAYAGLMMELIQGEGGFYPGTKSFFMALIEVCKSHSIPIFIDEIQTFGRTDHLFAYQHFGLQDHVDIVTVGKLSQVCATLYNQALQPKPGLVSQTFTSSATAISAAIHVLDELTQNGYLGQDGLIMSRSNQMRDGLKSIAQRRPDIVEGPYGYGGMIAFTSYKGDPERTMAYIRRLYEAGVIVFINGNDPLRVRFLMPIGGVTETDIQKVLVVVEECLDP
ncbi:aminotransferase class III-fold pyridoxal phosphate-dependent enzyme [bacterium]|jgi:acetylornithine/N-succinyldiaminopimelate aminotransferase|nr:aminotransferase class III-fold pyridoxal phosphate-dependent enzyme [bacterium]